VAEKKLDVFRKTEPEESAVDLSDLDQGNIRPSGVGLREGEIKALDEIGAELGRFIDSEPVARNALVRIAARKLISEFRSGKLTVEQLAAMFTRPDKPRPRLKL
jgi:hypothetical protein